MTPGDPKPSAPCARPDPGASSAARTSLKHRCCKQHQKKAMGPKEEVAENSRCSFGEKKVKNRKDCCLKDKLFLKTVVRTGGVLFEHKKLT